MNNTIALDDLEDRRAYRLHSRNLLVGFWDAENRGFLGIREKFGDRYLFTEYHYDTDARMGTAHALEALDLWLPEEIEMRENLDAVCQYCGIRTEQIWEPDDRFHNGQRCVGNRHLEETNCEPPNPHFSMLPGNKEALDLLEPWDEKFLQERLERFP